MHQDVLSARQTQHCPWTNQHAKDDSNTTTTKKKTNNYTLYS